MEKKGKVVSIRLNEQGSVDELCMLTELFLEKKITVWFVPEYYNENGAFLHGDRENDTSIREMVEKFVEDKLPILLPIEVLFKPEGRLVFYNIDEPHIFIEEEVISVEKVEKIFKILTSDS